MKIKKSFNEKVFDFVNAFAMITIMVLTIYPFLYVAFASVSSPMELIRHKGLILYPLGLNFEGYKLVFANPMISVGYINTLFYVLLGTALNIMVTIFLAYVLSKKNVFWKTPLMMMVVFTMYFSGGLIPTYLMMGDLGLINTRLAVILPGLVSTMNMIIMRTSFMAMPESLEESAKMDGANDITVLFRIVLPLSMPIIAVMILFYGVGHWNGWFNAMIYLKNRELFPLQLVIKEILIVNSTESMTTGVADADKGAISEVIKYATIIVATVPILLVYPYLQKYFTQGVMIGAIKG